MKDAHIKFLVIHKQIPHLVPGIMDNNGKVSTFYLSVGPKSDKDFPLCRNKEGHIIYIRDVKVLPLNHVPFDIKTMTTKLDSDTFFALKIFSIKSKLYVMSDAALKQHGEAQQQMWFKILGLLEPIFMGNWL